MSYHKYAIISFDKTQSLLRTIWKEISEEMTDEEFKEMFLDISQLIAQHQIRNWLGDTRLFRKIVVLELQTWVAETLNPQLQKAGLEKMAIILPEELITNLSVQQSIDEIELTKNTFVTQYFDTITVAENWLLKN